MDVQGKRILVVGMATSGIAAALFLRRRGAHVVISEMRAAEQLRAEIPLLLDAGVAIETGGHRERTFLDADLIVVSPGVPAQMPLLEHARAERIPVLGEIELASRFLQGTLVAITGANGKTTTTTLTGEILRACQRTVQVGGNIGTPLISLTESSTPETVTVVEASSFQLETIDTFHPHVAAVLNLSPDHLDRHGSMEAYAAAKERIFLNQTAGDFAVLNAADRWCRDYATRVGSQVRWFNRGGDFAPAAEKGSGAHLRGDQLVWVEQGREIPVLTLNEIPLRGDHNVENVLAAVSIACLVQKVGLDTAPAAGLQGEAAVAAIRTTIRSFKAVEHRLEFVARIRGVEYFNDSKATNVDATIKALEAFPGGLWVILGGKDKNSDYTVLAPLLRQRARGVLLIGAASEKIASHLEPAGIGVVRLGTMERAVDFAFQHAHEGDTVLLAPACSSFDQFQNYGHRGKVFKQLVMQLNTAEKAV